MGILKVSGSSKPNLVAGAIAALVRENSSEDIEIQTIGAGALNQAIKAIAIARGFITASGIDLVCIPSFKELDVEGEKRTAIRLLVRVN